MIQHHPRSIEDVCADEYAARISEAERFCRWLRGADTNPAGAERRCDQLVCRWVEFAIGRDRLEGSMSPIHPRFL